MLEPDFASIVSIENLLLAWQEFLRGKKQRTDVQEFQLHFMDNILGLYNNLTSGKYIHGPYEAFAINDPKPRSIHKASVRDRLLHHAIYRSLYMYFDDKFIYDSYSCRKWKGTHKALKRFETLAIRASLSHTKTLWVLKCDVRKFFASIDHDILIKIFKIHLKDDQTVDLLKEIIKSFSTTPHKGLPLGNLTSQLFVNIYMDWFDRWAKHLLKGKYYIRYADDFVLMHTDRAVLENYLVQIRSFLKDNLALDLHPDKVFIKTLASGVDFLGWVHFTNHRVLRGATRRRMMRKVKEKPYATTLNSYKGMLGHGNGHQLARMLDNVARNDI